MNDDSSVEEYALQGTITEDAPLEILLYDNPILRKTAKKVKFLDDETLKTVEDMIETMITFEGLGLAAPQVGLSKRLFLFVANPDSVTDEEEETEIKIVINPQILEREGEIVSYEGCLSYPDHVAQVKRALKVKVKYQDANMEKVEEELSGMAARAFQHELDHLDGILFIDRMEPDTLKHVDELREEESEEDTGNDLPADNSLE